MAGLYSFQDDAPLARMEQGPSDALEEPTESAQVVARCKGKRIAAFIIVALGATACVTIFKPSSGSVKWASIQSSIGLAQAACRKPEGFCEGAGMTYELSDCDGDSLEDHYCEGGGYCGCVKSSEQCLNDWPRVCVGGMGFSGSQLPDLATRADSQVVESENADSGAVKVPDEATGAWFILTEWRVKLNDTVHVGDTIAVVQPFLADGDYIKLDEIKARKQGYIVSMQDVEPGTVLGAGDTLAEVSYKPLETPAQALEIPWRMIAAVLIGLCLVCCIILLLAFLISLCCKKRKEDPVPEPIVEEHVIEEEKPFLAPEEPPNTEGVPIYFDNEPYYCRYKPLHLKLHQKHPIKVDNFYFNSYGKTLGLIKGQQLTRIVDEDVSDNHHYKEVEKKLEAAMEPLPWWPLRVEFKTPEGLYRTFDFVHRPLGIQFTRHLPIKVEKFKANSYAQECGVEVHWEITKIADEDVTHEHSFSHVDHNLLEGLKYLPEIKRR